MDIAIKKHIITKDKETAEVVSITVKMLDSDSGRIHTQGIDSTDWDKPIEEQCNIAMTAFEDLLTDEASTSTEESAPQSEPAYEQVETVFK